MSNQPNHIQTLAQEQKYRGIQFLFLTCLFVVLSFVSVFTATLRYKLLYAALLLACARIFFLLSEETKKRRKRLQSSLAAEIMVCDMLVKQLPPNWTVEANVEIPRCGDIDLVVTSAKGNYYAIEVKSHRTEVVFDGEYLRRGSGAFFEKDFFRQITRAAIELRKMRRLPYVFAILVFTKAKLSLPERNIRRVRILTSDELVSFLISQEEFDPSKYTVSSRPGLSSLLPGIAESIYFEP